MKNAKIQFSCIDEMIRRHNGHYFDHATMRYFRSKVYDHVINGNLFITSEKYVSMNCNAPRAYSIRTMNENGDIQTVGKFQQFKTKKQAIKYANSLPLFIGDSIALAVSDYNKGTRKAMRAAKGKTDLGKACKFLFDNLTELDQQVLAYVSTPKA